MNILHIAPYFPSKRAVHAGGVCMAYEIESLRALGHNVYCCSFYQNEYDSNLIDEVKGESVVKLSKIKKIIHCLLHPFTAPYFASRQSRSFYKKIVKIIKEKHIEAIHAEYAAMGLYVAIKKKFPQIKFNLVLHDVTLQSYMRKVENSHGIKKTIFTFFKNQIYKKERFAVEHVDCVLTFCEKDRDLVLKYYTPNRVEVINTYFGLDKLPQLTLNNIPSKNGICFMGQMGRIENENAATRLIKIYNEIKSRLGDEKLYILGSHPSDRLKSFASEDIKICGYVENIEEAMLKCKIAVFPLTEGAGIKIKVLTSMALGIPTITTDVGAEGIDEAGECLVLANDDEGIASEIVSLMSNNNLYNEISNKVARYAIENFSWQRTIDVLAQLYS